MSSINASLVKELRERTGAGMMDCKKALEESAGNVDAAIDYLKKKGISSASKKAARIADEGMITIYKSEDSKTATMLELNSETDFVPKNEKFHMLIAQLVKAAHNFNEKLPSSNNQLDVEKFQSTMIGNSSVSDVIAENIALIGEKLHLSRIIRIQLSGEGFIATYLHNKVNDYNGKLGVIVAIGAEKVTHELKDVANKIAMHIAAMKPEYINTADVPENILQKEKEIFLTQASATGKPQNILDKMVESRIKKFYEEIVLLEQPFVMDPKISIKELLQQVGKQVGCEVKIEDFVRLVVGEK